MTRWNPGKQERHRIVSELNGYLDTISAIDGRYRQHRMSARLIRKRGCSAEQALRQDLDLIDSESRILGVSAPARWTDVESYFRREFLQTPLAKPAEDFDSALPDARNVLAFRTSDLVMFLARDMNPGNLWHVELSHPNASSLSGCLIDYHRDALWITSWRRDSSA